jgi:hypothetical protein
MQVRSCPEYAAKWYFCHPCYLAQSLRVTKKIAETRVFRGATLDSVFRSNYINENYDGAPDCEEMER